MNSSVHSQPTSRSSMLISNPSGQEAGWEHHQGKTGSMCQPSASVTMTLPRQHMSSFKRYYLQDWSLELLMCFLISFTTQVVLYLTNCSPKLREFMFQRTLLPSN